MHNFERNMPKPLDHDYSGTGLRQPKEKRPRASDPGGTENRLSLIAMIFGICSVAFLFIPGPYSLLIALACGIVGIVLAAKAKKADGKNGMNKAGMITSIISLVLVGLLLVLLILTISMGFAFLGSLGGADGLQSMFSSVLSDMGGQSGFIPGPDVIIEDTPYEPDVTIYDSTDDGGYYVEIDQPDIPVYTAEPDVYQDSWDAAEPAGDWYSQDIGEPAVVAPNYDYSGEVQQAEDIYVQPDGGTAVDQGGAVMPEVPAVNEAAVMPA